MIENPLTYITLLITLSSLIVYTQDHYKWKIFEYLPAIVVIYFLVMLLSSFGVWQKNDEITQIYKSFKSTLLPAMIFLMLLSADLRQIAKLGKKMILTFFIASFSIALGFVGSFMLLHSFFEPDAWKTFGALSGSWMGGTANMVAIQGALNVPDSSMGFVLLIDSIDYAIWVMILLALVPFAKRFNSWSCADGLLIESVASKLSASQTKENISFHSLFALLGLALLVSLLSQTLSSYLPTNDFLTQGTWIVILATTTGIILAMTPIGRIAGSGELGNIFLYIIVALIASRADFTQLNDAPLYIFAGFIIIAIHATIMVLFAKLFKLDLFTLGVASLANIGGVASAPILAGAYSKALVPIGVLMAMMGYILGTFGGLMVAKVLEMIGS